MSNICVVVRCGEMWDNTPNNPKTDFSNIPKQKKITFLQIYILNSV